MKTIIEDFYRAFQNLDSEAMVSYYHENIKFNDPAFGTLHGEHAKNMWRMLLGNLNQNHFVLKVSNIEYNENSGKAHWDIQYTFSVTGRTVHNSVDASMLFKDGKIIEHTDQFDLHKWARQALGFKGTLLGGTHFFRKKLQKTTSAKLLKWESKNISGTK